MRTWFKDIALPRIGLYIPDREEGQGMAEYGLILAGVSILAIVAVFLLGGNIGKLMNKISSSLS
jgi:pilus assembly protein Flp/PilA